MIEATIVVAESAETVTRRCLLASPSLRRGSHHHEILIQRDFASAAQAYNHAIERASHDLLVFTHQDVVLPETWFQQLSNAIAALAGQPWSVLGVLGARADATDGIGSMYTRRIGRHGRWLDAPELVETLDEVLLVLRRSSGLRFDEQLGGFDLYGTDLCLAARAGGGSCYAFQGYLNHESELDAAVLTLNGQVTDPREATQEERDTMGERRMARSQAFHAAYTYIQRKWRDYLPIATPYVTIQAVAA